MPPSSTDLEILTYQSAVGKIKSDSLQRNYLCVINEKQNRRVLRVEYPGDEFNFDTGNLTWALVSNRKYHSHSPAAYSQRSEERNMYLVSTENGQKILVNKNIYTDHLSISPGGKYFFWFDIERI